MNLMIPKSKYTLYKRIYQVGLVMILIGIFVDMLIVLFCGVLFIIGGTIKLNQLFQCPHCGTQFTFNLKKKDDFNNRTETCLVCKKKITIEIK